MADQLSSYMREQITCLSEERKSVVEIIVIFGDKRKKGFARNSPEMDIPLAIQSWTEGPTSFCNADKSHG